VTAQPIRALPVDLEELSIALEAETADLRWYLDLVSGDVVLVTPEYDPAENDGLTVAEIEGSPARFVRVPPSDPSRVVDDMRAFVASLGDPTLQESLALALSASRPEKRFKAALSWLPERQHQWHGWYRARCQRRALDWLARLGIEPTARAA
jgi:hypothetical protein